MSITKITTPELLDFPKDSTSSVNTSGTVIPTGYTNACNFPTSSSGVALYEFENNANDTCGNYNLTEVGSPSYVASKTGFGEAIQFNGTSQGATSSSAVIPNGAATISLWFNGNGTATTEFYIIGVGVGGSAYGLDIHYYNSGFWAGVVDGGSFQGVGGGVTTVNTSTWYHLALTWDGSTNTDSMKLYLNGALETNITPTVTAASLTYSSFGICHFSGTSTYAPGIVDQVRIFNSVLTPTQITELYNETTTEEYRPTTSLNAGEFRFNTTTNYVEYYDGSTWLQIADEYITGQPSACICNYPTTATALYQFNSNATDTCGNYNGTNDSGITYGSPGKFGNAAQFGGGADRIDIDQALLGSGTTKIWSTSFWFLTSSTAEQYMNNTGAASSNSGFGIFINPTNGYLRYQTSSGSLFSPYLSLEDRSVQDGNWHHVVATYSSAGGTNDAYMYLYLDGVNVTSLCTAKNSWTQGGGATWGSFTIPRISLGNWADSSSYPGGLFPLIGSMDQLRFFNTALTQTQVTELYNETVCN